MFDKFKSENSKIEFYAMDENKFFRNISENETKINKVDNMYFTYWLDLKTNSRRKEDFVEKRGFFIDLDLRKNYEIEYLEKISDEDIIEEWLSIWKNLKKENKLLWEFSFIVFSWNWLQIHYLWDWQYYTPEEYSIWVKEIYKLWDEFWADKIYVADPACCNISRVMRVPWTINQKNWSETKIIFEDYQISELANSISIFANKKIFWDEKEKELKEKEMRKKFNKEDNNFYEEINKIPANIIAEYLLPQFKFNKNGKNFDNLENWFCWYYYNKNTNSICNGGSRYFNWGNEASCFNNFSIIKNHFNLTNKDTFEFFKTLLKK